MKNASFAFWFHKWFDCNITINRFSRFRISTRRNDANTALLQLANNKQISRQSPFQKIEFRWKTKSFAFWLDKWFDYNIAVNRFNRFRMSTRRNNANAALLQLAINQANKPTIPSKKNKLCVTIGRVGFESKLEWWDSVVSMSRVKVVRRLCALRKHDRKQ